MLSKLKHNTKPLNLTDTIVLISCFIFSSWLMFSTFTSSPGQLHIDSKLWSDFGAHIPLIRSFSHGHNLPPEYPTFPGEPIRYHFLFYMLVGFLEKAGLGLSLSLNLLSTIGFTALIFLIYKIAKLIFSKTTAGILAIILFLFNGSLSFLNFFQDQPFSPQIIPNILSNTQFASFGPWDGSIVSAFWNLNIYTNQRHLALGFAISLLVLWPLLQVIFSRSTIRLHYYLVGASAILLLPFLHQASFFITLSTLTLIFVLNLKFTQKSWKYLATIFLAALPGLIWLLTRHSSQIAVDPGFLAANSSPITLLHYWWHNLGLYLPLIPIVFILSNRRQKSLMLAVIPLFLAANILRLSPDMINNHKLINYFMIIVVILTSGQLIRFWSLNHLYKPLIALLIFLLTLSGILDIFPIVNDHSITTQDIPANATASWIHYNTPLDSTFLTTTYFYNPASLAGRKTYLDYGYFNWSLGYDDAARQALLPTLFDPDLSQPEICQTLINQQIDYVMISPGESQLPNIDPHQSVISTQFEPEHTAPDGTYFFSTQTNCQ